MKIAELLTALGGGALVGWVSKAFIAREARLTREADVEREVRDAKSRRHAPNRSAEGAC